MGFSNLDVMNRWIEYNGKDRNPRRKHAKGGTARFADASIFYCNFNNIEIGRFHDDQYALVIVNKYKDNGLTIAYNRMWKKLYIRKIPFFEVPDISNENSAANLEHLENVTIKVAASIIRTFNDTPLPIYDDHRRIRVADCYSKASDYAEIMGMAMSLPPLDDFIAAMFAERDARRAKYHSPAAVVKRERAEARKQAVKAIFGEERP